MAASLVTLLTLIYAITIKGHTHGGNTVASNTKFSISSDGLTRDYYIHWGSNGQSGCDNVNDAVILLHGGRGGNFFKKKKIGDLRNQQFAVIAPRGLDWGNGKRNWIAYHRTSYPVGASSLSDYIFLHDLANELKNVHFTNLNNLYVAGFSSGGQMALGICTDFSDIYSASNYAVPLSGIAVIGRGLSNPLNEDESGANWQQGPLIYYQGGTADPSYGGTTGVTLSFRDTFHYLLDKNGCDTATSTPDDGTTACKRPSHAMSRWDGANCDNNIDVRYQEGEGEGHVWTRCTKSSPNANMKSERQFAKFWGLL